MPFPSFLCVGMPKCGTSTLHDVLEAHPQIFVPPIKEIKFLAYAEIGYHKQLSELSFSRHWAARQDRLAILRTLKRIASGQRPLSELPWLFRFTFGRNDMDWYMSLFPADRIRGDISPSYCLLDVDQIRSLRSFNPDLRIIIMLRSPLQMMWSHCRMSVVKTGKSDDLSAFHANIEETTRFKRTYRALVEEWSTVFGDNVFVGYLEEMAQDPGTFFANLLGFLGADVAGVGAAAATKSHVGVPYAVPEGVRAALVEHTRIRLEGFEAVSPTWAEAWRAELDDFAAAGGD